MARIAVQLRRCAPAEPSPQQYGALDLDLDGRRIRLAGNGVELDLAGIRPRRRFPEKRRPCIAT